MDASTLETTTLDLSPAGRQLLADAYGRAARRGQGRVGTEHLLSVLLDDREVAGAVLGPAVRSAGAWHELLRSRGARWTSTDTAGRSGGPDFDEGVEAGVTGCLREVQRLGRIGLPAGLRTTPMIFSGALVGVVCAAARRAGPARAGAVDLALALLDDPASRAHEALRLGHVDLAAARRALGERSTAAAPIQGAHPTGGRNVDQLALAEIRRGSRDGAVVIVALGEDWLPPQWLTLLDRVALVAGPIHRRRSSYRLVGYDELRRVYVYQFHSCQQPDAS
jgi:Clp amino terminal domain, pathogenicity island component